MDLENTEKTDEKTCYFYKTFSNSISNCTLLPSFTIGIFFFQKFRGPLNVLQDLHKDAYSVAVFQKCKKYLTCALTETQTFG